MKKPTRITFLLIAIAVALVEQQVEGSENDSGGVSWTWHADEKTGRIVGSEADSSFGHTYEVDPDSGALTMEELDRLLYEKSQVPRFQTFRIVRWDPWERRNAKYVPEDTGYVNCVINAQIPHKGKASGTVKAKSGASCSFTHRSGSRPSPNDFNWDLVISIYYGRAEFGSESYEITDDNPLWRADPAFRRPGTQVDSGTCLNGLWSQTTKIFLTMSPPYAYVGMQPVDIDGNFDYIDDCR